MALGDPPQNEKRPSDVTTVEQVQQLERIADYTARQAIPIFAAERAGDAADVKPFLDVDGQAVARHTRSLPAGRLRPAGFDEIDDGAHALENPLAHLLVADDD